MNERERMLAEGPRVAPESSHGGQVARPRAVPSVQRSLAPLLPAVITFGPFFLIVRFLRPTWSVPVAIALWLFVIRRFGAPMLRGWNAKD